MSQARLGAVPSFEAVRLSTATRIHPWDTPVGALPILEHTLAEAQDAAIAQAGGRRVRQPGGALPVVLFTDRQWFTGPALRRLLAAGAGRLTVTDAQWLQTHGSGPRDSPPGRMELGWVADVGESDDLQAVFDAMPSRPVNLQLEDHGTKTLHPRLRHAHRPLRVGAASVHCIEDWTHLVRTNQLAIQAEAYAARDRFASAPLWRRWVEGVRMVWRAGGITEDRLAAALVTYGADCRVHPSAVVEASRIGRGVHIGPHAVVRGSVLQDGVRIDEHATVVSSVLGPRARLGPYGHLRYCTVFGGARVSAGPGYQLCAFGADCFLAWGVAVLDLRFDRTVRTEHAPHQRYDTGHHFLGCAVGHRAVVGQGVRLAPGAVVPSDATLFAPSDDIYRQWGPGTVTPEPVQPHPSGVRPISLSADGARRRSKGFTGGGQDAVLGDDAADEACGRDVEGEVPGG